MLNKTKVTHNMRKEWIQQDIDMLFSLYEEGKTRKEIAIVLDRTESSIKNKCFILGLNNTKNSTYRRWTAKEDNILEISLNKGMNYKDISILLDRTAKTCKLRAYKLQITFTNSYFWLDTDIIKLKKLIKDKKSYKDISSILNKSISAIEHKVFEYRLDYINSSRGGFQPLKPGYLYCIYFKDIDLYKIGISNNYTERLKQFGYPADLIYKIYFEDGKEAANLEIQYLKNINHLKVNTGLLISGNTETFRYE